jgi:peptidoglycan/xylan/chitin deacetylase (PgdA/CDA1 family)
MTPPAFPGGKRIAVLVSVLLETWSDGKYPGYFPRTTALKAGMVDHAAAQWSRYGAREGVWRLLAALDRRGIKGTLWANGIAAERHPAALVQALDAGHDVGAHGYAQDQFLMGMTPEEQRIAILRTADAIGKISGAHPEGWLTPVYGADAKTYELIVEEGFRWHADALDTSFPYVHRTDKGPIVALPWSEFVDNRVLRASPRDYYDVYQDSFDYLRAHEPLAVLHVAAHSHFGGRPMVTAAFDRLLAYFKRFDDVWFCRHAELVQWFSALGVDELPYARRFAP